MYQILLPLFQNRGQALVNSQAETQALINSHDAANLLDNTSCNLKGHGNFHPKIENSIYIVSNLVRALIGIAGSDFVAVGTSHSSNSSVSPVVFSHVPN